MLTFDRLEDEGIVSNLLPHGEEFLFVETLFEATEKEINGACTFRKSHPAFDAYPFMKTVPSFFILEALFQCGGAGARYLKTCEGFFGIAKIDKATFSSPVGFDKQMLLKVQNTHLSKKIIKQSGKVYINNKLVAEAQWVSVNLSFQKKHSA